MRHESVPKIRKMVDHLTCGSEVFRPLEDFEELGGSDMIGKLFVPKWPSIIAAKRGARGTSDGPTGKDDETQQPLNKLALSSRNTTD